MSQEDPKIMLENYKTRYRELVDKYQQQRSMLLEAINILKAISDSTYFLHNLDAAHKAIDDAKQFLQGDLYDG